MAVIKRSIKGAPLTHAEMDGNWDEVIALGNSAATKSATTLSDTLTVNTNALVVNANKRVLIGATTDNGTDILQTNGGAKIDGPLKIGGSAPAVLNTLAGSRLLLTGSTTASASTGGSITLREATSLVNPNGIEFYAGGVEIARLPTGGYFLIGSTVTNTTDGNAKLQTVNGIYLGNTANSAAKVLDWYEEGTFTPTVIGGTVTGTGTYSEQYGSYTRIGNRVVVNVRLAWSAHTGTGAMLLVGLPFAHITSFGSQNILAALSDSISYGTGKQLMALIASGETSVRLYAQDSAGGAALQVSMDAAGTITVSGIYHV